MTSLAPAPILATILAEMAHDWTTRLHTRAFTVTVDEAVTYAAALRDLALSARLMSETFSRIVAERNLLLSLVPDVPDGPVAPVVTDNVIDLSAVFTRERAFRHPHHDGGAR